MHLAVNARRGATRRGAVTDHHSRFIRAVQRAYRSRRSYNPRVKGEQAKLQRAFSLALSINVNVYQRLSIRETQSCFHRDVSRGGVESRLARRSKL